MLKNVLKEIDTAKIFSVSAIAKNLNTTEALIEEAIMQLIRMGYIDEDKSSSTCETSCNSCSMSSMCNIMTLKTISITDKGKKLLKNI